MKVQNIDLLTQKIKEWANDRNLITADPKGQIMKLIEEIGELTSGVTKQDIEAAKDGIGDAYVVLTILAMQLNLDIAECIAYAYDEIKDRKGRMVNGIFVKEEDLIKGRTTPLKRIRENSGLMAKYVSDKAGISRSSYSRYETGQRPLPIQAAMKIAPILNVDWWTLTGSRSQ